MTATRTRVIALLAEHLPIDGEIARLTDDARFVDLGADSLDSVTLVMEFEEEFGVQFADDAADGIVTVGDAVCAVERIVGETI